VRVSVGQTWDAEQGERDVDPERKPSSVGATKCSALRPQRAEVQRDEFRDERNQIVVPSSVTATMRTRNRS
jgi:hypothetical protein